MRELHSVYFRPDHDSENAWLRMARVLELSARDQLPDWRVDVRAISPAPAVALGRRSFAANTVKLDVWRDIVCGAADGTELLLIDSDTLVRRPLDVAFAQPFDVAFTRKRTRTLPINAGVVFVRASQRSRDFFRRWCEVNQRMYDNPAFHKPYELRFGGINQAALGYLLEHEVPTDAIAFLDCGEWNACYEPLWAQVDAVDARIVHYKSHLRKAIFGRQTFAARRFPQLVALWHGYDAQAVMA